MNETRERYVPALGFHALTPLYDAVVRLTTRERTFKTALLQQADLRPGHTVLDLACGTGTLALAAKRRQPRAEIVGLDGDAAMLDRARAKAARAGAAIRFEQGLSHELPYADASFDRVLCSLFFHHLGRAAKRRAFAELHRVLKPGGALHAADWGEARDLPMRLAYYGIQLLDGFANTADNVQGLLPGLMRQAGFAPVRETRRFPTMWGTMALYAAEKPGAGRRPRPPWGLPAA